MKNSIKRNLLLFFLLSLSAAPLTAVSNSLFARSVWPDPDSLPVVTQVAIMVVALGIGHTSAIGFDYYWKKSKKAFVLLSTLTAASLGILTYTSLVNSNLETRLITFSTLGLGVIAALVSSSIGIISQERKKKT